ncbi:MAG TPA: HdeA/HdeB family chaperone [Xanthobacteraceae bacterium]|nr:HdeA/HdeB family chaperone [Xanthobacteraceae bacterium]
MIKAKGVVAGLVFAAITAPAGHAQVTIDVAKITCIQFATYKIASPQDIALWLSGFYNGKRGNTIIDPQALKANSDKVVNYCLEHPDTPVMEAVETLFGVRK